VLRLDDRRQAEAVDADPDAILRSAPEPVLVDEWQLAPAVLGAVKRAVDDDWRPGRFIITGSVHARLEQPTWPGTGRLARISMTGLTARELLSGEVSRPPFIERVAELGAAGLHLPGNVPDLRDYVELALRGGFPEAALASSTTARRALLEGYLDQLFTRDVDQADGGRDPYLLRRFFEAYALNSAGIVTETTLAEATGISRRTADNYERLLSNLYIVDPLPAWSTNRLKRLARSPKRYVIDPSLVATALDLDTEGYLRDADLLGRLIDTFVVAQLRAELQSGAHRVRLHHLRDQNGEHEVDLVVELGFNQIIAIEIKAHSAPTTQAAKHLRWLRDQLGDRFIAGLVLHTGPHIYPLDAQITAAPICTIWG
jgi:predicted AAA+ superfamily ATPase